MNTNQRLSILKDICKAFDSKISSGAAHVQQIRLWFCVCVYLSVNGASINKTALLSA